MNYLEIIKYATIAFPLVAFLFTMPFILHEYHKLGSISFYKSVVIYLFIYYLICAYFLVILPLPKISEVLKLTTSRVQLIPFQFVIDFIKHVEIGSLSFSSLLGILKSNYFYVPMFNVLLTLPFGFFLSYFYGKDLKKVTILSFILSLFFELTQLSGLYFIYPRGYRLFDVDDLILNTFGGVCGYFVSKPFIKILPSISEINLETKIKGKVITGFRRSVTLFLDLFIVSFMELLFQAFFKSNIYLELMIIFGYYFLIPLFLSSSTLGEKFLNIQVLDYNLEINQARLYLRRGIFILIYIILPCSIFKFIMEVQNDIFREFGGLVILGIFFLVYIISFIKYMFTSKDMFYEKLSKTRLASTIR